MGGAASGALVMLYLSFAAADALLPRLAAHAGVSTDCPASVTDWIAAPNSLHSKQNKEKKMEKRKEKCCSMLSCTKGEMPIAIEEE